MDIEILYSAFLNSAGICTDTRAVIKQSIFFCLKGDRFDANEKVQEALDGGAGHVVTNNQEFAGETNVFIVEDTLVALQDLARYHRQQLGIPVVAIAGSNGKTTTKELTALALAATGKHVFATPGNFNNHIGVPLSLLKIKEGTDFAIIELGANAPNETGFLCTIAQPDSGLVTNNGLDHLEGFGSPEGIEKANAELYDYLAANAGVSFVNTDEKSLLPYAAQVADKVEYAGSDLKPSLREDGTLAFEVDGVSYPTHLFGLYNVANVASALCIAQHFGIPIKEAAQAIIEYVPSNMRSQLVKTKTNTVIVDAYNANPSSMEQALNSLSKLKTVKRVVIMGDMLEMGEYSLSEHKKMLTVARKAKPDILITVGKAFQEANEQSSMADICLENGAQAKEYIIKNPISQATVLLKGSRGIGLEQLLEVL